MEIPAISLKGVSKYYKLYKASKDRLKEALHPFGKQYHENYYAIRDLDLEVKRGEILGIVGRNGCGKSTLLKLISRVLQPNAGEVRVHGKITALLELGAGFNPEFTGRENIRFYSTILGLSAQEIERLTPTVIEFAELGQFIDQPVKTYSSGMKSRLGFAVAVHVEPDILILNEVLAVGDAVFKRKCFAKMEEFFRAGKTVLFVSHDANAVNKLCTRAALLHGGNIILDGKPSDVTRYYEKLAYTNEQNQPAVLAEIASFQQQPRTSTAPAAQSEAPSAGNSSPYYIAELISKSALAYPTDRAEILDPHITTTSGERVNVLLSGGSYIYCYHVHFQGEAHKVSFGMQIKDLHGVAISAASLASDPVRLIEHIPSDTTLKITWPFNCHLLEGHYFTNAGVSENINSDMVVLARFVDAMIFKVIAPKNCLVKGIVDLGQTLEVETL